MGSVGVLSIEMFRLAMSSLVGVSSFHGVDGGGGGRGGVIIADTRYSGIWQRCS